MKTSLVLLLALGLLGGTACSRREAPQVPQRPNPEVPPTPKPEKPDQPTPPAPRPYVGYEGYTLLYDSGLVHVLTGAPDEVGGQPHLFLLDREGKQVKEVLKDFLGDYEGKGRFCDGSLTEAGPYLALLGKYDFTDHRKHQSRLILLEKQTMRLVSNRLFAQPGRGGDEWVRQSFTLADGTTYLTFDKRSYYLLPKEGTEMTKLDMPKAYAKAAHGWGKRGYFFLEEDEAVYQFEAGQTSATKLPLFAGTSVLRVYPAGGPWLILRDQSSHYQLFSMQTGRTALRFTLSEPAGRSMLYDEATQWIFFSGEPQENVGAASRERSVLVVRLTKEQLEAGGNAGTLKAELFYRLAGRSEADNRIGMQMQLGLQPDRRQLFVSWLDQGRGGPLLHPVTKAVSLPLDAMPTAPSQQYTLSEASDVRSIITLARVE